MMVIGVEHRTVFQEFLSRFARSVDRVVNAQLYFAFTIKFQHQRELGEIAAGILNLAPAESDRALHSEEKLAPFFFRGRRWDFLRD